VLLQPTALHIVDWLWLIIPMVLLVVAVGFYFWLRPPPELGDGE
jgi:hypothetical protein